MMKINVLKNLRNVISGKPPVDDLTMIFEEVKNDIIGNLHREYLYSQMDIWSDHELFLEESEGFKEYLINQLSLRGESIRAFAQRLSRNGIGISEKNPSMETRIFEVKLPGDRHVWYSFKKTKAEDMKLFISCNGTELTLEPGRYKLGRETASGDDPNIITITDKTQSISNKQIELYYNKGNWYCINRSEHCQTRVQHYNESRNVNINHIEALTDNSPFENKIEFYNRATKVQIVLKYNFVSVAENKSQNASIHNSPHSSTI